MCQDGKTAIRFDVPHRPVNEYLARLLPTANSSTCDLVKDASVVDAADVLLHHPAISRPQHYISSDPWFPDHVRSLTTAGGLKYFITWRILPQRKGSSLGTRQEKKIWWEMGEASSSRRTNKEPTLEESAAPAYRVGNAALALGEVPDITEGEVVAAARGVLGEDVLELLGLEAALGVVGARVAAVLVLVDAGDVEAEEGIGQPARHRRVGEVAVDDQHREGREEQVEAQAAEAAEGV